MSIKKYFFLGISDETFEWDWLWEGPKCGADYWYCLKYHVNNCPRHAALIGNPFTRPLKEPIVVEGHSFKIPLEFKIKDLLIQMEPQRMLVKLFYLTLAPKSKEEFPEIVHITMKLQVEDLEVALSYIEKHYPNLEVVFVLEGYRQA